MGDQGQERLQQAEGQQPGEEEDEELARDGSRRRVRLHRIVQRQVHDADRLASTSVDSDAGSLLFIAVRTPASVDDGPRPFDDAKGAVSDVGPVELVFLFASLLEALVYLVALRHVAIVAGRRQRICSSEEETKGIATGFAGSWASLETTCQNVSAVGVRAMARN